MMLVVIVVLSLSSLCAAVPQDPALTHFYVTNVGRTYVFDQLQGNGPITDSSGDQLNPPLTLEFNRTYTFQVDTSSAHAFAIHREAGVTSAAARYNVGVTGQRAFDNATLTWVVSESDLNLFYQCEVHATQFGPIRIGAGPVVPASTRTKNLITAHAVLMTVAFAVLLPLGALTSSFLPAKAVTWWLPLHISLMVAGAISLIGGLGCIVAAAYPNFNVRAHQVIGVILIGLVGTQMILGLLSEWLWRYRFRKQGVMPLPGPLPEKTHWWLGRTIIVVSVAQVFLGLDEAQEVFLFGNWVYGVYAAWYGLLVIVSLSAFIYLRSELAEKRRASKKNSSGRYNPAPSEEPTQLDEVNTAQNDQAAGIIEL